MGEPIPYVHEKKFKEWASRKSELVKRVWSTYGVKMSKHATLRIIQEAIEEMTRDFPLHLISDAEGIVGFVYPMTIEQNQELSKWFVKWLMPSAKEVKLAEK